MPTFLRSLLVAAQLAFASVALAQATTANPPVQAVVAYMNLIDPRLVQQVEMANPNWNETQLALGLIDRLAEPDVIEPPVAAAMRRAIADGCLSLQLLQVFVVDVVTGVIQPLTQVLLSFGIIDATSATLEQILANMGARPRQVAEMLSELLPGVLLPGAALGACIADGAVSRAVLATLRDADAVTRLRDRYADAISPIAEETLARPRGN